MNINDAFCFVMLTLSLPMLVFYYLKAPTFSESFRTRVVLLGLMWMAYSLFFDTISVDFLGVWRADEWTHITHGTAMAKSMHAGDWDAVWNHAHVGNANYQVYVGFVMYLTGTTATFLPISNGWLAFWGGLILIRHLSTAFPGARPYSNWALLIIFCPSVVFWTTKNIKMGLMYWSICQVLANGPTHGSDSPFKSAPLFLIGVAVGTMLRAHVMMAWVSAVCVAGLLQPGRRSFAAASLALLPLILLAFAAKTSIDPSIEESMNFAERTGGVLASKTGGSDIEYGPVGPIFFVSGFISLFFRPFLWEAGNLRLLLAIAESWITTGLILGSLLWMIKPEGRKVFGLPEIRAAFAVCILFSVFFTYLPNEGLMVRQRVQAIPALLILVVLPRWKRRENNRKVRLKRILAQRARVAVAGLPHQRLGLRRGAGAPLPGGRSE